MNFHPVLFCSAAIFLASAPVWADRIDPDYTHVSDDQKISTTATPHSDPSFDSPFGAIHLLGDWRDINGGKFADPQSTDPFAAFFLPASFAELRLYNNRGRDFTGGPQWKDTKDSIGAPVATSEPASLSLLMVGLLGLGFLAQRRRASATILVPCEQ